MVIAVLILVHVVEVVFVCQVLNRMRNAALTVIAINFLLLLHVFLAGVQYQKTQRQVNAERAATMILIALEENVTNAFGLEFVVATQSVILIVMTIQTAIHY